MSRAFTEPAIVIKEVLQHLADRDYNYRHLLCLLTIYADQRKGKVGTARTDLVKAVYPVASPRTGSGNITEILNILKAAHFIESVDPPPEETDQRIAYYALTEAGVEKAIALNQLKLVFLQQQ